MQMYDGLPTITNKIPVDEQRGIKHHLLGCVGLEEPTWRVGKFVQEALKTVRIQEETRELGGISTKDNW